MVRTATAGGMFPPGRVDTPRGIDNLIMPGVVTLTVDAGATGAGAAAGLAVIGATPGGAGAAAGAPKLAFASGMLTVVPPTMLFAGTFVFA